jgi:type I restriction enzyme, S subunit
MSESPNLPWETGKLGKLADVRARIGWRGLSSSEYTDQGPFLIAGQHISSGQVSWNTCDHISDRRYIESWEISLKNGDVILTKDGTIGRVARIDILPGRATINGTMMLLRCHQALDYRYLSHYLQGEIFTHLVEDRISGSSIPHIFQRDMVRLDIPLPDLGEQRRIAEILDTADEAIRSTERLIAKLEQAKQGLLHDLLTRGLDEKGDLRDSRADPESFLESPIGVIPSGWSVGPLSSYIVLQRGFDITVAEQKPGNVPVVSSSGISSFHDRSMVKGPGVVIGRKGKLGDAYYITADFWPHDTSLWVKQFKNVLPEFAAVLLKSMRLERFDAATSVPTLNRNFIHPILIAVPPTTEQAQILSKLDVGARRAQREGDSLAKLRLVKKGLMDDLLTGRVRAGASG